MDEFEKRLKRDAGRVRADVPPELRARIAAALQRTARGAPSHDTRGLSFPLWLAGSLSGLTAAILLVVLMNRGEVGAPPAATGVARSVPEYVRQFEDVIPLRAETADLTAPLEEELARLRADIDKARENVERDLDFTF